MREYNIEFKLFLPFSHCLCLKNCTPFCSAKSIFMYAMKSGNKYFCHKTVIFIFSLFKNTMLFYKILPLSTIFLQFAVSNVTQFQFYYIHISKILQ